MHLLAIFGLDRYLNLSRVQGWIEAGGYVVLFALLFACGLGLPLPEDIPLLLAGFFVYHGKMQLAVACVVAWCGIIGGDCVLYNLGKRYGMNITKAPMIGKHVTQARIQQAETLFQKYGIWVVAVGRLFAGIRGGMVVAAGTIRYNFVKFIIADGLAALVSGGLWIWLGWWGGKTIGDPATIMQRADPYKHWIFVGILGAVLAVLIYISWRRRRHETISQVLADKVEEKVVIEQVVTAAEQVTKEAGSPK
jgi:membrane protein DedA with SNARE-associated domain